MPAYRRLLKDKNGNTIYPVAQPQKWVPDYANENTTNLWTEATYTATQTGFLHIYIYGYSIGDNHSLYVYVNSHAVFGMVQEAPAPNGARAIQQEFVIPICQGDVLSHQGANAGKYAHFIPGKFVD